MSMIPVNEPIVSDKAKQYVNEALDTGWISSSGKFIDQFETNFAQFIGVKHATTVANGTVALHLALACIDLQPGDEVIIPDLTIISCPLAVMYMGAKPVFVDVERTTGNIDPEKVEAAITPKTKAIMVVHLYGHPCDMDEILAIAKKHNLKVVEDAAEAHGALYKGKKVGSFGDIATFSFYANKVITTGEGGMVVMNDTALYEKAALLKNLAHKPGKRFWHEHIGYNYRFTNVQAAMGLAHLEEVDTYILKKQWMRERYNALLQDIPYLILPTQKSDCLSTFWMYNLVLTPDSPISRDELMIRLKELGVDTRTYFYPLHEQPILAQYKPRSDDFPISSELSENGFYLPSGLTLTEIQVNKVSEALHEIFKKS